MFWDTMPLRLSYKAGTEGGLCANTTVALVGIQITYTWEAHA